MQGNPFVHGLDPRRGLPVTTIILPAEAGSVVYLVIVLGVLGLIAAAGLWMLKGWALWLTIVVSVLNMFAVLPGSRRTYTQGTSENTYSRHSGA